jgi:hypothetical protein
MRKSKFHPIESVEMPRSKDRTHITERTEVQHTQRVRHVGTNEENRKVRLVGHSRSMQGIIQKQNPKIATRTKTKGEPVPGT